MRPYDLSILLFSYILPATPFTKALVITESPLADTLGRAVNISSLHLEKRDDIDDWNNAHPDNRIAAWFVCPDPHVLFTVFNAMAVWQAFSRGVWFAQHPNEDRPRWSGVEYPHAILLDQYHAQRVDLGLANGALSLFPLQPGPLGEWPGLPGAPATGPPGDHRVVFDEHGMFAGVVALFTGVPEGERLVWCYPMLDYGARDVGATAEGNPGVDEAWQDRYDGNYLYAPDPAGGSRPPSL
ncbi:hypothetical protein F4781DRAFT_323822 [Annulohypoxylon bovei var. microspora]|nr:hypothetical protein F4781DRAFT_323822 [Annulohypoxylon bovei var. microspora]